MIKQSINPNDKTARIYDLVNTPLKGVEITDAELELIQSICALDSDILDIGAGTGRHAITLANKGYNVTVIDSSKEMLEVLRRKAVNVKKKIKIVVADVTISEIGQEKFDLIIMMWNAFDEIVHTEEDALKLLRKCKTALKPDGRILIDVDDSDKLDMANINFHTEYTDGELTYKQDWKVIDFDPPAKTTTSEEVITVVDIEGREVEQYRSEIVQTWWCKESMGKLAELVGMKLEIKLLPLNQELYFVLG